MALMAAHQSLACKILNHDLESVQLVERQMYGIGQRLVVVVAEEMALVHLVQPCCHRKKADGDNRLVIRVGLQMFAIVEAFVPFCGEVVFRPE